MFSCKFVGCFQNFFSQEHLWTAASGFILNVISLSKKETWFKLNAVSDARFYFSWYNMFNFLIFADTNICLCVCWFLSNFTTPQNSILRRLQIESTSRFLWKKWNALQELEKGNSTKDVAANWKLTTCCCLHGRKREENLWHI